MATAQQARDKVAEMLNRLVPVEDPDGWVKVWQRGDDRYPHYRLGAPGEPVRVTVSGKHQRELSLTIVCNGQAYRRGHLTAHSVVYYYTGLPDIEKRLATILEGVPEWRAALLGEMSEAERRWGRAATLATRLHGVTLDGVVAHPRETLKDNEPLVTWDQATYGDHLPRYHNIKYPQRKDGLLRCELLLTEAELLAVAKLIATDPALERDE